MDSLESLEKSTNAQKIEMQVVRRVYSAMRGVQKVDG
jgi:hypothetical protein